MFSHKLSLQFKNKSFLKKCYASGTDKRTALYDVHVSIGGKMVPFGGWEMPVQYSEGVLAEHLHTRKKAGLFDVSHMGQLRVVGKDRNAFLEYITVADMQSLQPFCGMYSFIPNEKGGLIDDIILANAKDYVYVVVNAGCYEKDMVHIRAMEKKWKSEGKDVTVEDWKGRCLFALQGPLAEQILQKYVDAKLDKVGFFKSLYGKAFGVDCYIQRSGYTGEDGFEISVPTEDAVRVMKELLSNPDVKPIGLGARDSLRVEAGLPLYGHEIDQTTTPKEANLVWPISKRRQEEGGFIGADIICAEIKNKKIKDLNRRRVGIIVEGPPARENVVIMAPDGKTEIGHVTSGTVSPCTKQSIAMGYVKPPYHEVGAHELHVVVRGKTYKAKVCKLPFVPTNYKHTTE